MSGKREHWSGNENIKVNTNFTYNPSTNTVSQINIAGNSSAVNFLSGFPPPAQTRVDKLNQT